MEQTYIGVDVGNYDTKTALSSTPSGYSKSEDKPFGVKECIFYNGMYYAPSERRFLIQKIKQKMKEHLFFLFLELQRKLLRSAKGKMIKTKNRITIRMKFQRLM